MPILHNSFLRFSLDPHTGAWNLTAEDHTAAVDRARIGVAFRVGRTSTHWMLSRLSGRPVTAERKDSAFGRCSILVVEEEIGPGVAVRIEWILPAARSFLLWKMILANAGNQPVFVDWFDLCLAGARFGGEGGILLPAEPARRSMFVNGWQSWSFAGGRRATDRQPGPRLGPINAAMHIGTLRRPSGARGHFVSDMFAVIGEEAGPDLLTAGFLSQREQFGLVETRLGDALPPLRIEADADGVRLDPGASLQTDRAFLSLGVPPDAYFEAAACENRARVRRSVPAGWSSWYYFYTAIDQAKLERNTDAAAGMRKRLPLQLIQLDDGYQAGVGDWLERNSKFPLPMDKISGRIRKAGFTPGVWLSPFLVETGSKLAKEHPDWLASKAGGVMSNVKPAWVRETRSLDVTRPPVLDHIRRLIRTAVAEWRFPFLKLDYLYIPAAKNARLSDPTLTRAQALRRALEEIRAAAGEETFLLGCGCPLGSGIGIFDAMRIGPDVDSIWKPHLFHQTWAGLGDPTIPAAWNAVRNTLARTPLHRCWWWNDPDCLLARDCDTRLTVDERRSLAAAVALSGGMVLLSDDLPALSPASLRLAQALFPPLHRAADLPGWRGEAASSLAVLPMRGPQGAWWMIGVFNWGDRPADRFLDLREWTGLKGEAAVFSLWDERFLETAGGQLVLEKIPPHGSVLLSVVPRRDAPQWIGSNLHYSQGAEVAEWKSTARSLRVKLRLGRMAEGAVWLSLPGGAVSSEMDRKPVQPRPITETLWKFPVRIDGEGVLTVRWNPAGINQETNPRRARRTPR